MALETILIRLNVITLLNSLMPPGSGELITFLTFIYAIISPLFFIGLIALTKEITIIQLKARLKNMSIGEIPMRDGHKEFVLIPKGAETFTYKIGKNMEKMWVIKNDSFRVYSNGVRHTILHPDLPNNISIDELTNYVTSEERNVGNIVLSPDELMATANDWASFKTEKQKSEQTMFTWMPLIALVGIIILGVYLFATNYHPTPSQVQCVWGAADAVVNKTSTPLL